MKKKFFPFLKFKPGDTVHEVFWDDDIFAWNVGNFKVEKVKIVIEEEQQYIVYCSLGIEIQEREDNSFFKHSLDASKEAIKRNKGNLNPLFLAETFEGS